MEKRTENLRGFEFHLNGFIVWEYANVFICSYLILFVEELLLFGSKEPACKIFTWLISIY